MSDRLRALSRIPATRRPSLDLPLIGRIGDLAWLNQKSGDRVLVGQPGVGKTFLLKHWVNQEGSSAFFVVDRDLSALAEAIRDLAPSVLIVDDAFVEPRFLSSLRQMRLDIGLSFDILATTWPGSMEEVGQELGGVSNAQIRTLEGMTRRELRELFTAGGISGPEDLLMELIRQARNKPGLASSLIHAWRRADSARSLDGQALAASLFSVLHDLVGEAPRQLLGVLGLGGRRGLKWKEAADFLQIPIHEAQLLAAGLAAAGLVEEERGSALVVVPEGLRSAAFRHTFFGPLALPGLDRLFEALPDKTAALESVLQAAHGGAEVDRELLVRWLGSHGSRSAWGAFATLGESEARWTLDNFPDDLAEIGQILLEKIPRLAIRRFLSSADRAISEPRPGALTGPAAILVDPLAESLSAVSTWLSEARLDSPSVLADAMKRRAILHEEVYQYFRNGGSRKIAAQMLARIVSPRLHQRPGIQNGISRREARINPVSDLFPRVWQDLMEVAGRDATDLWPIFEGLLAAIAKTYPDSTGEDPSWASLTTQIVAGLRDRIPVRSREATILESYRLRFGVPVEIETDPIFECLEIRRFSHREAVDRLNAQFARYPAAEILEKLIWYSKSMGELASPAARIADAARKLASETSEPALWLDAWLRGYAPPSWLEPLLKWLATARPEGWETRFEEFLRQDRLGEVASLVLLGQAELPSRLLDASVRRVEKQPFKILEIRQLSEPVARRLLCSSRELASMTAEIEWLRQGRKGPRAELEGVWREAVLHAPPESEVLDDIFECLPDLFAAWMSRFVVGSESAPRIPWNLERRIGAMTSVRRLELLASLSPQRANSQLVKALVARSNDVYRSLLLRPDLNRFRVGVLEFLPDPTWNELAELAMAHGVTIEEALDAAFESVRILAPGNPSVWLPFRVHFESLAEGPLSALAVAGLERADARLRQAEEQQRLLELTRQLPFLNAGRGPVE